MTLRSAIVNLIISMAIVAAVVLVAVGAKFWRQKPELALKAVPLSADPAKPLEPQASEKFVLLSQPTLIDVRGDQADRLRIRHSEGEHDFALYFIEALGGPNAEASLVEEQARWFRTEARDVRSVGQDAALYAAQLLRGHSIEVLTRWEPTDQGKGCYYALVFVKMAQGSASLGEQLLGQGFARVGGLMTALPSDNRELAAYLMDLKLMDEKARKARLGIWGRSRQSLQDGGS